MYGTKPAKKPKKLFNCHLTTCLMVVAEDEWAARVIAKKALIENVKSEVSATDFVAREAHTGRHRVYGERWKGLNCPYGQDDSPKILTVNEIFNLIEKGEEIP